LEQITKYLTDQDAIIKGLFKTGKTFAPESIEKKEINVLMDEAKAKLKAYFQKEK
jgi:hypothetical protein